ncbi:GNAT family N-acetyltransferase [Eubacteriales bacterium OttesenSCG-928-A19]|nr:GNAT family N-acetyltransferase [Eubacteriales bacterium OttesenSCG-928-A19]
MPVELPRERLRSILPLFAGKGTHRIAQAGCLGLVDCRAFVDAPDSPSSALLILERFGIGFAAGNAAHAASLLECLRGWHSWYEISDPPPAWHPALAGWTKASFATTRYAFADCPDAIPADRLRALAVPPEGFTLRRYDEQLIRQALSAEWSEDQLGTFLSADAFLRDGVGVALLREGALVAGCTSFCRLPGGFEVQVDTHPEYRKRGLATCVSAAFILDVMEMGLIPYWDAANRSSLRLAERLGYVFQSVYPAWMLVSPETTPEDAAARAIGV